MKIGNALASIAFAAAVTAATGPAFAATAIDINGSSSVGSTLLLGAGTYQLSFVDNTAAGGYNGFSFWNATSGCASSSNCSQGFTQLFEVLNGASVTQYIKLDPSAVYGYNIYDTAAASLAGYQAGGLSKIVDGVNQGPVTGPIRFTLTGPTSLNFVIQDSNYSDNRGGVSLSLSAVPEPATWAMLIMGFGAIGGLLRASRKRLSALAGV